jgi:hypothetical protein
MTDLQKRLTRLRFTTASESRERGKYRKITVEAHPDFMVLRLAGLRTPFTLTWDSAYSLAVKQSVAAERAEKAKAKKAEAEKKEPK